MGDPSRSLHTESKIILRERDGSRHMYIQKTDADSDWSIRCFIKTIKYNKHNLSI